MNSKKYHLCGRFARFGLSVKQNGVNFRAIAEKTTPA
jgi:hypothetical protein